jgi:hypothetical protein
MKTFQFASVAYLFYLVGALAAPVQQPTDVIVKAPTLHFGGVVYAALTPQPKSTERFAIEGSLTPQLMETAGGTPNVYYGGVVYAALTPQPKSHDRRSEGGTAVETPTLHYGGVVYAALTPQPKSHD